MDWIDYSQQRRIRNLEEDLSDAQASLARKQHRMRSELKNLRGNLEQRLNRVSATLDAFIELSDLRATLALFGDAALARRRTLQVLDDPSLHDPDLKDVPGYWLVPAAHGLHALTEGDHGKAQERFDEAERRDAARARYFTALATALTDTDAAQAMGGRLSPELLPHLPPPGEKLTRGERALWLLTADGSFGSEARENLLLSTIRHWSREGASAGTPAGLTVPPGGTRNHTTRRRDGSQALARRTAATTSLSALRENLGRLTALDGEDLSERALAPDQDSAAFLQQCLQLLVEEGSTEEAPLLKRSIQLRSVIEGSGGREVPVQAWTDAVGTVDTFLSGDLADENAPTHRRTFALALQRPSILDTTEDLLRQATEALPEASTVSLAGSRVEVSTRGISSSDMNQIRRLVSARTASQDNARPYLWTGGGMAVLFALLGVISQNGLVWFLALLCSVGAIIALFAHRRERDQAAQAGERQLARAEKQADEAVEAWKQQRDQAAQHATTAEKEAQEIRRLLSP